MRYKIKRFSWISNIVKGALGLRVNEQNKRLEELKKQYREVKRGNYSPSYKKPTDFWEKLNDSPFYSEVKEKIFENKKFLRDSEKIKNPEEIYIFDGCIPEKDKNGYYNVLTLNHEKELGGMILWNYDTGDYKITTPTGKIVPLTKREIVDILSINNNFKEPLIKELTNFQIKTVKALKSIF